jgi:hypothetical protein
MERALRIVPLLIAGAALVAAAEAPMASIGGPTRSPQAKKVTLPANQVCKIPPFQFDLSKRAIVKVQAAAGNYCANQFKPQGIVLQKFRIDKQPKNGIVNLNAKDQRWYYRAKPGFKGDDMFILDLAGYDRVKWGETKMLVYVKVD